MSTRIIVDSTIDLMPDITQRVTTVPLSILFGTQEYLDGVTMSHEEFYEKLKDSDRLPTTSQPTPLAFKQTFDEITAQGDEAIVFTISSKLSGTYQTASMIAQDYDNIHVIDSHTATIGTGILVEQAFRYIDAGEDLATIIDKINADKDRICVVALLDTLDYLARGGRIPKAAAAAGSLLKIKPVVALVDGEISLLDKAHGRKQGNTLLMHEVESAGCVDFERPTLLGYTGTTEKLLERYIDTSSELWREHVKTIRYTSIGSVIGTHTGPNAIVVAFFRK